MFSSLAVYLRAMVFHPLEAISYAEETPARNLRGMRHSAKVLLLISMAVSYGFHRIEPRLIEVLGSFITTCISAGPMALDLLAGFMFIYLHFFRRRDREYHRS